MIEISLTKQKGSIINVGVNPKSLQKNNLKK